MLNRNFTFCHNFIIIITYAVFKYDYFNCKKIKFLNTNFGKRDKTK